MITRTPAVLSILSTSLLAVASSIANAEAPPRVRSSAMPEIDGGVEIALALNSAVSLGDVGGGMDAGELVGNAAELDLQVGTRLTPNLALGFYTTGQALTRGSEDANRDVYTGSAGIEVDFHTRPSFAVDPWVSVGTGLRAMLIDADGTSLLVGAELARVQLGVDFRVDDDFSLGPVIGASASLYGAHKQPMRDFEELNDKGINWTISMGVGARFNAGGSRL